MNHYSKRLETELVSGILRAEHISLWILHAFSFLLLEMEEVEGTQLLSSATKESLILGREGRVLEDDSKKKS